jgi:transposase
MRESLDLDALGRACAALGIDVDTLPAAWRTPARADASTHAPDSDNLPEPAELPLALTDAEWAHIAPLLPAEPPQAGTRPNREVLDRVLWVVGKGRRWTDLGEGHEAVRRKFGRWAHLGVWQRLAAADAPLALERRRQLQRLAQRAARLAKH